MYLEVSRESIALILLHHTGTTYYIHQYILITNLKMNWVEAQSFCRAHYSDLATIYDEDAIDRINKMLTNWDKSFWIGLYDDVNGWKWSLAGEHFYAGVGEDYKHWQENQPDNAGAAEHCVSMMEDGLWRDNSCTLIKMPLICFRGERFLANAKLLTFPQNEFHHYNTSHVILTNLLF